MGYTHYWYRPQTLPKDKFGKIVEDMKKVQSFVEAMGIPLKGWDGTGDARIEGNEIVFNGNANCGHTKKDLGITWPAPNASGVGIERDVVGGSWFVGALLSKRTCGGDCSHETFRIERVFDPETWEKPKEDGTYFAFCKTAYKPYDLAVTACLVIAKHHLGDLIRVSSDGDSPDWADGKRICQEVLGYGLEVVLDFERERAEVV